MQYDPIKDVFSNTMDLFPQLRKLFFMMLDTILLRQRYVKKYINKYLPPDQDTRFYDAGAGFCQYSDYVMKRFPQSRVFAVDLKTDYLSAYHYALDSKLKQRFSFKAADLQDFRPTYSYDMVVAIDIMEHIEDDISTLQNFMYCLKPGGRLIISTPSDTDEAAKFTAEHVRPGYNKSELEAKLQNCGFEIEDSIYSYGFWGKLAWQMMIKKPLTWIGVSKYNLAFLPFYYLLILPLSLLFMNLDLRGTNKTGTGIIVVAKKPENWII
ncbi:MAG: hypothetical protein CVU48_08855 [Candidatus Cloacimonetes bacterium HGW-Cloacimonetes-1]|jgi:cyclopropane fatty-acyl-phospholipid synthase-like methyltransferase|nr:MAG: hypothetical protein CVU48_08855 [Candidatus Cloacimonetes bacterium HGW-Cloacimonetes-1]